MRALLAPGGTYLGKTAWAGAAPNIQFIRVQAAQRRAPAAEAVPCAQSSSIIGERPLPIAQTACLRPRARRAYLNRPTPQSALPSTPLDPHALDTMTSTIGIPIKLLNEAQGHIVTLEITSGQTYRGKLLEGKAAPLRRGRRRGPGH